MGRQPNDEPVLATLINTYSHVGTHIEASRHIDSRGRTLDDYPLSHFIGPARVVDASDIRPREIGVSLLERRLPHLDAGSFVFFNILGSGGQPDNDSPYTCPTKPRTGSPSKTYVSLGWTRRPPTGTSANVPARSTI